MPPALAGILKVVSCLIAAALVPGVRAGHAETAKLALCRSTAAPTPGVVGPPAVEYRLADGNRLALALTGHATPAGCVTRDLGLRPDEILWFGLAAPDTAWADEFALSIADGERALSVVEIAARKRLATPLPPRTAWPVGVDLMPRLEALPFGAASRLRIGRSGSDSGAVTLECKPGREPAGLRLQERGRRLPSNAALSLAVGWSGAPLSVAVANAAADRRALGRLGGEGIRLDGDGAAFLFDCPDAGGRTVLADLRLLADATAPGPAPIAILSDGGGPHAADGAARREFAPIATGAAGVVDGARLGDRLRRSAIAGRETWASIETALSPAARDRAALAAQVAAYAAFNRDSEGARIGGVLLRLDPSAERGLAIDRSRWLSAYVDAIETLATQRALPFALAVPLWMTSDLIGQRTLDQLADFASEFMVFVPPDKPDRMQAAIEPALAWASGRGRRLWIGFEPAGPRGALRRMTFARAAEGPLWRLQVENEVALVLIRRPLPPPLGDAFALQSDAIVAGTGGADGSGADPAALREALAPALGAWRAFAGFVHSPGL